MPKRARGLTAVGVQKAKVGKYCDGSGLWLTVRAPDAKYWSFRFKPPGGKLREMGLGAACGPRAVSLAEARRKARDLFDDLHRNGLDPLAIKTGSRAAKRANAILSPDFRKVAIDYIEAHRAGWTNQDHANQWLSSLTDYAFPVIGSVPVADIEVAHIESVLLPIWNEKPTTARRLRGRVEKILGRAKVLGLRAGANPASWRENLDALLPKLSKDQRTQQHHNALPYREIGDFLTRLRAVKPAAKTGISAEEQRRRETAMAVTARALEFTILCAARANETLGARWDEIDFEQRLWTVPGSRTKTGLEHAVPLSARAVEILRECEKQRSGDFVFQIDGKPLTKDAMLRLVQYDLKRRDATVHGFRSTFADWRAERTNYPSEVAEAALGHADANKVRSAYQRTTFFDLRKQLMTEWAAYCGKPSIKDSGKKVLPLRKGRAS